MSHPPTNDPQAGNRQNQAGQQSSQQRGDQQPDSSPSKRQEQILQGAPDRQDQTPEDAYQDVSRSAGSSGSKNPTDPSQQGGRRYEEG